MQSGEFGLQVRLPQGFIFNDLGRYVPEFTSPSICRLLFYRREVALHSVDTHRDAVHE